MSTQTATVESLTAKVQVLMVGSRQVTLSIARQLDRVPLADIDPFGRVRLGDKENLVIGKTEAGILVIAPWEEHPRLPEICSNQEVGEHIALCKAMIPRGYASLILKLDGKEFRVYEAGARGVATCRCYPYSEPPCTEVWSASPEAHKKLRAILSEHERHCGRCAIAADLPLIVLAGLGR